MLIYLTEVCLSGCFARESLQSCFKTKDKSAQQRLNSANLQDTLIAVAVEGSSVLVVLFEAPPDSTVS